MPQMNPDGTVQVAPPTMSAFSPAASASAPAPPMAAGTPPTGAQATPGAAGAIQALIAALAQAFAPKGLTQRRAVVNQTVDKDSASGSLGDQF